MTKNPSKTATITKKQDLGENEVYRNFYRCSICRYDGLGRHMKYCPNCGRKLIWEVQP